MGVGLIIAGGNLVLISLVVALVARLAPKPEGPGCTWAGEYRTFWVVRMTCFSAMMWAIMLGLGAQLLKVASDDSSISFCVNGGLDTATNTMRSSDAFKLARATGAVAVAFGGAVVLPVLLCSALYLVVRCLFAMKGNNED